jgi:hypothetical protein
MILHVALFRMPPLKLPENSVINDVNAVPSPAAPILIGITLDRWCSWFLDLAPIIDAANETASRAVLIRYASQPNTVWPMVPDQGAWGVLLESPFAAPSRDALFFWAPSPLQPGTAEKWRRRASDWNQTRCRDCSSNGVAERPIALTRSASAPMVARISFSIWLNRQSITVRLPPI